MGVPAHALWPTKCWADLPADDRPGVARPTIPFVFTYLDDILVASSSPENHMHHLKEVFVADIDDTEVIWIAFIRDTQVKTLVLPEDRTK